jgi:uncharacterized protein (DUF2062 family)
MRNAHNGRNGKARLAVRIKRRARLVYLKLLRIDDPPERIARGAAIGVLMGVLPTFGAGAVMALALAFVFKANKAAAVLGSMVANPLTSPFFWSLSVVVGSLVLGEDSSTMLARIKEESLLNGLGRAYTVFLAGNAVVSAAFTGAAYYVVKKAVTGHRARKAAKAARRPG